MRRPVRSYLSEDNLKLMHIPKQFWDKTLDDFDDFDDKELQLVKLYVKRYIKHIDKNLEGGNGIYFCGSNGVGKTMLACLILKEAYRHRYTGMRVTLTDYVKQHTAAWGEKDHERRETMENEFESKYKSVELLVLEELGKELDTKLVRPVLEDLLRYREDNGLTTIFCSNMGHKMLRELYGESIYSLIKGNSFPITIQKRDRRG